MRSRSLVAPGLVLLLTVGPLTANAQSRADSVRLLVQAALVAVDSMAPAMTILLDPRPEFREDPLSILVFDALSGSGYEEYKEPGIPPRDVWLLSPGGFWGGKEGTQASARFRAFGRREGRLNSYSYSMTFRVECHEGACVLGHWLSQEHGDGHLSSECWEDFFSRTDEGRKECYGFPRKPGSTGPRAADIL